MSNLLCAVIAITIGATGTAAAPAHAEGSSPSTVTVNAVSFGYEAPPGGDRWTEIEVVLVARQGSRPPPSTAIHAAPSPRSSRYVSHVEARLTLCYRTQGPLHTSPPQLPPPDNHRHSANGGEGEVPHAALPGPAHPFKYYSAHVTTVALRYAQPVSLYFYLPPEVIERDHLPDQPYAWVVELSIAGIPQKLSQDCYSRNLTNTASAANLLQQAGLQRVAEAARHIPPAMRGSRLLFPIYDTPFYNPQYQRQMARSPAYLQPHHQEMKGAETP